eukprot:TRINITY_DN1677_c0_g1_i2.p1 TRINITY_DN1677_c0_g1~~TRINITY_DN1677_c0_g1_i2.p1  ORF type:complete len:152 (+),score=18.49 TRINITY_DN1677_c0_g1_i2:566-1021(+)
MVKDLHHQNKSKHVSITGHSLGGAFATLATVDLAKDDIVVANLITYGSPRVGNQAFVEYFYDEYILTGDILQSSRITYKSDIVPRIPPRFAKYAHIPHQVRFSDPFNYTHCKDGLNEDLSCLGWGGNTKDHMFYLGYNLTNSCNHKKSNKF